MTEAVVNYVVKKRYSNKHLSPSGCKCVFFKINDRWGIKAYDSATKRDECYNLQLECANYGFGPAVGDCFTITLEDKLVHCYVTEVAQCLIPDEYFKLRNEARIYRKKYKDSDNWANDRELIYDKMIERADNIFDEIADEWNEEIEKLTEAINDSDIDWYMSDNHAANFGLLDGKLVCIDFGRYDAWS